MDYYKVDYQSENIRNHNRKVATTCNKKFPCNHATAGAMQSLYAFDRASTPSLSIPRDFLTSTTPQQCANEPDISCDRCDVSYRCMKDNVKQQCFECARKKLNVLNKGVPFDPYAKCFFSPFVKPE